MGNSSVYPKLCTFYIIVGRGLHYDIVYDSEIPVSVQSGALYTVTAQTNTHPHIEAYAPN